MSDTNTPIRPGTNQPTFEINNESDRDILLGVSLQQQFQSGQFQAGGFTCQNSGSNEYGLVPGNSTNPTGSCPDGGGPAVPNMQTANMQEQNPFQLSGNNEMFAMPNQRSFPQNTHPYPQLPLRNATPTAQNTRISFNQVPQNLSPALVNAVNRPPLLRQPSQPTPQPQPQSPTPLARQVFPFWGFYFQNFDQVNTYLNMVAWFPSMGRYGLPQSAEQYRFYLEKISSALLSIRNVWDIETAPWQLGKFLPHGEWTNARDTEAIAHIVVLAAMRIHVSGVTDFAHTRSIDYKSWNSEDVDFTFPQRMHFVAILLHHSKAAAAEVMARVNIDKYVATPITVLRSFAAFEETWNNAALDEKHTLLEVEPYVGSGVTHPPPELQAQLANMAAARFQQMYNAPRGRDSSAGPMASPKGQVPGDQGSPSISGTNAGQSHGQANARAALPGSNERFQSHTPYSGQNLGEGANSPDIAGV